VKQPCFIFNLSPNLQQKENTMEFTTFASIVFFSIIFSISTHWIIRNAVSGGIKDARNKAEKERAEKGMQARTERKRHPLRATRDNIQTRAEL
jgi:hypothetical protein